VDGSTRHRRRDSARGSGRSRNVDASAGGRQASDVERRRRRRRHHSVSDAISRIDVRVPLRLGQDTARPAPAAVTEPPAAEKSSPAPPVAAEERTPAERDGRRAARVVDEAGPRRTPAAAAGARGGGGALVGVDLRRLGRRCRSLDNVASAAADHRTYALLIDDR